MLKLPTSLKTSLKKIGILYGVAMLSLYLLFRVQLINLNPFLAVFSIILFIAEMHTMLHLYGMFYSIWPRKYPVYNKAYINHLIQFNMFICVCGEPADIVASTIAGAKEAADFYVKKVNPLHKPRVIVLNDGFVAKKDNWQEIIDVCKNLGVECITRTTPGGFKAGNINNALKVITTTDPENTMDIIFDADFAAKREFLTEIVKPFADQSVDFVQSPQRYRGEMTWVAKASAAHQIFFFDYICPAKGHDNALFLCGTNFAIRRSALDSVGGIDTNFITEDYATSINLHLAGKKGVFMPKVLALGVAPTSLKQYFSQQQRWSKGSFDTNFAYFKQLFFGPMTFKQKFHYFLSATYYLIGLRDLILMLAPLPYLLFGVSLIKANTLEFLALVYGPLLVYNFILYYHTFTEPVKSIVLDIVSFPVFTVAFLSSVTKKQLSFIVTIKKYEKENPFSVYRAQLFVIGLLIAAMIFSLHYHINHGIGAFINYFWAIFDVSFLSLGFYLIARENYNFGFFERVLVSTAKQISRARLGLKFIFGRKLFVPIYIVALALVLFQTTRTPIFASFVAQSPMATFLPQVLPQLKSKELLVPTDGIYYGYYEPTLNVHPEDPQVTTVAGEKPSLTMYYQDWGDDASFDTRFMNQLDSKGVVPVVTWEPWDSKSVKLGTKSPEEYTPREIASGKYDAYIHEWAKSAALYNKPFYLRFAHEMNGNWYQWSHTGDNTPQDYIAMWQHVHDIFTEEKATNVIWVWSPNNTDEYGSSDSILSYYPGDNYVDWVGFSGFNWGKSRTSALPFMSFKDLSYDAYVRLSLLNKPIMISETSSVSIGGDKTAWFDKTLTKDIPDYPKVKAVIFYDSNFGRADFDLSNGMNKDAVVNKDIINNGYYLKQPQFN